MGKTEELDPAEIRKRERAIAHYKTRLSYLKKGQLHVKEEKYSLATEAYLTYLTILGNYFNVPESKISPQFFDAKKDLTELLLISHVYWDLAKVYDMTAGQEKRAQHCLEQFIKFTIGYKYQHINAQIVRKFLKKGKSHNSKIFEDAYKRIQVSSKKCYIATHCFGENHPTTNDLRKFKQQLVKSSLGLDFIDVYYQFSPEICDYLERNPKLNYCFTRLIARPVLSISTPIIRKLCS